MSGSDMMYSSSIFLKISGELHSLTAFGRLLNSLGPIDVKKLYRRVLILLLRAFRFGIMHWGLGSNWRAVEILNFISFKSEIFLLIIKKSVPSF